MIYFNELDDRQKINVYKAGFESFITLSVLCCILIFCRISEITFFMGDEVFFIILYIGMWYFNIRKTILDCEVPHTRRKTNRITITWTMIISTIFVVVIGLSTGWRMIDYNGSAGPGVFVLVIMISGWIITIIEWIKKVKGFEE